MLNGFYRKKMGKVEKSLFRQYTAKWVDLTIRMFFYSQEQPVRVCVFIFRTLKYFIFRKAASLITKDDQFKCPDWELQLISNEASWKSNIHENDPLTIFWIWTQNQEKIYDWKKWWITAWYSRVWLVSPWENDFSGLRHVLEFISQLRTRDSKMVRGKIQATFTMSHQRNYPENISR